MPQMGGGRLCGRLFPHETVRGQSNSRRHSQTSIQDKTDKTRHTRFIDFRRNAFGFGVAASSEIGLILSALENGGSACPKPMTRTQAIASGTTRSTSERCASPQVKSAVHVEHLSSDVTCHWRRQEQRGIDNLMNFTKATERNLFDEVLCHFLRHAL